MKRTICMKYRVCFYCFFAVLIILALQTVSCKREGPPVQKGAVPAQGPYTNGPVLDELRKKLIEDPNDKDTLYHLADVYDRNGQYADAVETYKKAVKMKPDWGYAYFKMGTAYDRLDKPAEAVVALEKAAKLMPDYAVAYNNLGIAYGKLGKPKEEAAVLEKAVMLRPGYATARYNLGVTYLKTGRKDKALNMQEALKKIDEGLAEALLKKIEGGT